MGVFTSRHVDIYLTASLDRNPRGGRYLNTVCTLNCDDHTFTISATHSGFWAWASRSVPTISYLLAAPPLCCAAGGCESISSSTWVSCCEAPTTDWLRAYLYACVCGVCVNVLLYMFVCTWQCVLCICACVLNVCVDMHSTYIYMHTHTVVYAYMCWMCSLCMCVWRGSEKGHSAT